MLCHLTPPSGSCGGSIMVAQARIGHYEISYKRERFPVALAAYASQEIPPLGDELWGGMGFLS